MSTPSLEGDLGYAADMLDAASRAVRLTAGKTRADLETDELFQLAMLHLIQVVGEAAFKTSPILRQQRPEVPWSKVAGIRHRIVHDYSDVNLDVVWDVLTLHLPILIAQLKCFIPVDLDS